MTPSFNQSRFIEQTLQSVIGQHYPQLEYIVIDGDSTDGSVEIIRRYSSELKYWVSEPDHGQAAAINTGFSHATGEILGWLNSDDILFPGALDLVGEIFARFPQIAWLTGLGSIIDQDNHFIRVSPPAGKIPYFVKRGWYHGRLLGFIRQESTFWRRELWLKVGGCLKQELMYGIDFDLWRRFSAHADLVTVHSHLAAFRQHPHQKTASLERYYREIGFALPNSIRLVTVPTRAILGFLSLPFAPHLTYEDRQHEWRFHSGPFFKPGVF